MDVFLSCDWGTSSFRLRLVQMENLEVLGEVKNNQGISATHTSWQQTTGTVDRLTWYRAVITQHIERLKNDLKMSSLRGVPVVLSGMASSSIGLMELPYKKIPFRTDGSELEVQYFQSEDNPLLIVSGVCTANDVMRGEETKIVGAASLLSYTGQDQLLILPGTHPKHVVINHQQVVGFETFMTGEFFALLTTNSILSGSVEKSGSLNDPANRNSFISAVIACREIPLLHHSFMVRTNQLLKSMSKEQNYHYLSGMLIGEELKTIKTQSIYLLGAGVHNEPYVLACEMLGIKIAGMLDADKALIKGQQVILLLHQSINR